jgi:hypothetical protein
MDSPFWSSDVFKRAMEVASADPAVKRVTLEVEHDDVHLTLDVRPVSLPRENGNGHFTAPVITEIIQNAMVVQTDEAPKPGTIGSLRGQAIGSLREPPAALPGFDPPPPGKRKGRGQEMSQKLYYGKYALAVKDMKSPIRLAPLAARMVIGADTLRHYYYADPPKGRYKTFGLGWGAAPGCRAIGE